MAVRRVGANGRVVATSPGSKTARAVEHYVGLHAFD